MPGRVLGFAAITFCDAIWNFYTSPAESNVCTFRAIVDERTGKLVTVEHNYDNASANEAFLPDTKIRSDRRAR